MKSPDWMTILPVLPHNYEEIVRRSAGTKKGPYSREDLERMRAQAQARNTVVMVMFMDPRFWRGDADASDEV